MNRLFHFRLTPALLLVGLVLTTSVPSHLFSQGDVSTLDLVSSLQEPESSVATATDASESVEPGSYEIHRSVVYKTYPEQDVELKCDVLVPEGTGPFPTILMIHGGGWRSGSKLQIRGHAVAAARKGYVAICINYRHAPKFKWPCQIDDCRQALDWMKKNAAKYKIDTGRVAAWGYSAGGQLAAFLGTKANEQQPIPIKAIVCGGGPVDLTQFPLDFPFLSYFMGDTRRNVPQRYKQASPITHLDHGDPPIFLFHGENDLLVPIDGSKAMKAKADKVGVACQFYVVPGKEHLFAFFDQKAFDLGLEFLDKYIRTEGSNQKNGEKDSEPEGSSVKPSKDDDDDGDANAKKPSIKQVEPFTLPAVERAEITDDKSIDYQLPAERPTLFYFVGIECPLAKLYSPRIQRIADQYADQIDVIAISSNRQDSVSELKSFADRTGLRLPIGKDYDNRIADKLQVTRTTEVVLADRNGEIVYRGRIDDQYSPGIVRAQPRQPVLKTAINELLAGDSVSVSTTESVGCLLGRVTKQSADSSITYSRQIAPIFQTHCVECHRPGEIGPFEMVDYDEIIGWGDMIVEVIDEQRMPPWHANPKHGKFKNARIMSATEKETIRQWVKNGMPLGDVSQLPPTPEWTEGWALPGKPDQIISMRKQPLKIPSEGVIEYQYFVVDPKFKTDRWVSAAQVLPGNRSVVHHSIVFVRPPDGGRFRGTGWLSAYVPGQRTTELRPGYARLIPAGSKLVFQQHYTPTGVPQVDLTRVGLKFVEPSKVTHEVFTIAGLDQEFEIPPETANFKVSARVRGVPRRGELLAIAPHMHLRGKSFRAFATPLLTGQSDTQSKEKIICDVPRYDFNWQHSYEFEKPIDLATIAGLRFDVAFDNSQTNPVNPDPAATVTWGDQTFEEMAVAFYEVAVPLQPVDQIRTNRQPDLTTPTPAPAVDSPKVIAFVDRFFKKFDQDQDGAILRDDLPISTRTFGFGSYDLNRDQKLTRDEILQFARRKFR